MTVTTVFATAPGGTGSMNNIQATYSLARASASGTVANHVVGQDFTGGNYNVNEAALIFNTSGVPDTDVVSSVVLSLDGITNGSVTDFDVIAAASTYDGGATLTTDFVAGASLAALAQYAHWNSSGYSANYNVFTEDAAFAAAINKTGNTAILLFSAEQRDNSAPTGQEFVTFTDADAAGTTTDATLDITHDVGGATSTIVSLLDEVSGALNANQRYLTEVDSVVDEVQAALAAQQRYETRIGASVDELTASFNATSTAPSVDVTITASLDEVSASLEVVEHPQVTIAAMIDEAIAALNVNQSQLLSIDADLDELTASLNVDQRYLTTIDSDLDELTASLNARQSHLVTVGATVDELTAALAAGQTHLITLDGDVDELAASLNVQSPFTVTITALVDEATALLNAYEAASPNITATLDELTAALNAAMLPKFTITAILDELLMTGRVDVTRFFSDDHVGGRVTAPPAHASIGGRVSRVQDAGGRFRGPPPPAGGRRNTP